MSKNYWINRWALNDIGFNQSEPHRYIKKYKDLLLQSTQNTVLFPLCGCSIDMCFILQQGGYVKGIEISAVAIERFFKQHDLSFTFEASHEKYCSKNIEIMKKSIFDIKSSDLGSFNTLYDRACFVAFDEKTRKKYIDWLYKNTFVGCTILMVLYDFEYEDDLQNNPPFPVKQSVIQSAFGKAFTIDILEEERIGKKKKWREKNIKNVSESAVLLRRVH